MPDFRLGCFQNEYLPKGAREVNAVVTITGPGEGHGPSAGSGGAGSTGGVEVIAVDTSASMAGSKIVAAREATAAAVAAIKDGVRFAVVAGDDSARVVYPQEGALAVASPRARA